MKTITYKGQEFTVEIERDDHMGAPWEEHDGHGVISDWTNRDKRPGERILNSDGSMRRYYDVQATGKIAKRDAWGGDDPLGKDFERMRAWCNDEWEWFGVVVTDAQGKTASLWGIESDADGYLDEVAKELAEELL